MEIGANLRLAAIFAAEVVGDSRLMGAAAAGPLPALRTLRETELAPGRGRAARPGHRVRPRAGRDRLRPCGPRRGADRQRRPHPRMAPQTACRADHRGPAALRRLLRDADGDLSEAIAALDRAATEPGASWRSSLFLALAEPRRDREAAARARLAEALAINP